MEWEVEYTDEFSDWWDDLVVDAQDAIDDAVAELVQYGPTLGRPMGINLSEIRKNNGLS